MKPSSQYFGLVCAAGLLLGGCLFKPVTVSTRYFVLTAIPAAERASLTNAPVSVGVGFVKMPAYALRDAVAVRKGTNEIEYLDDAMWAERLDRAFQRTLAADLATLLPSDQVYLSAWERNEVKVTVFVEVEQFDMDTHGEGTLSVAWRLGDTGNDNLHKSGRVRLTCTGPSPRGNPQAVAKTLSTLTGEFSRKLAAEIHEVVDANGEHAPAN
jgi:uncharacterized lipoprotein YmbA